MRLVYTSDSSDRSSISRMLDLLMNLQSAVDSSSHVQLSFKIRLLVA
jgi:hypothetical protein